jgi:hypothetical protein
MSDFPPPNPNDWRYNVEQHNPTIHEANQKRVAKRAGWIAFGVGFIASLSTTGYFIDGAINGAIWFGIVYGVTRLIQKNRK